MRELDAQFDVVVIGGGPAGSACAGLLAKRGRKVLLLEKQKFPRYHVGESLLTGGFPTLQELGLLERIEEMRFIKKYGATFRWGSYWKPWDFRFKNATEYDYSFEVRRADFDSLMLTRARELGATVVEEADVSSAITDQERVTGVEYTRRPQNGRPSRAFGRFVIDATGLSHLFGRTMDLLGWHEDLRNVAIWTYFQGCARYKGTRAGDTVVDKRPNGWMWFIPMFDGTTSIGYVTRMGESSSSRRELEQLFTAELSQTSEVRRLSANACRVSEYRIMKEWSYTCKRLQGPGWALVGDAAAFIDPLISTGVTLALRSSRGLAEAINLALVNPSLETEAMTRYEEDYKRILGQILTMVRFLYGPPQFKDAYHRKAQEIIDPSKRLPRTKDFALLLSGHHDAFRMPEEGEAFLSGLG